MIQRMLPGNAHQQDREDAYQSVCEALLEERSAAAARLFGAREPVGLHPACHREPDCRLRPHHHTAPPPAGRDPAPVRTRSVGLPPALLGTDRCRPGDPASPSDARQGAAERGRSGRSHRPGPSGASSRLPRAGRDPTIDLSAADELLLAGGAEDFAVPTPEDKLVHDQAPSLLDQALAALQQTLPRSRVPNAYMCNWRSPVSRRARSPVCSACRSRTSTSSRKR